MLQILQKMYTIIFISYSALLDRQQSTLSNRSEKQASIRRKSIPVPPRKASMSFPDPLFDPDSDSESEEPPSRLTPTQLILSRLAIFLLMLSILIAGILCRVFIPPPNSGAELIDRNSTSTVMATTASSGSVAVSLQP